MCAKEACAKCQYYSNIDYFTCYSCWMVVIHHFETVGVLLDKILAESSYRE